MELTSPALYLGNRVAWDGDRLTILDDELLDRLNKPYLSASTSKAMHSCPARLVSEKALPSGFDLFGAPELGTAAHTVLEQLYGLTPGRRDQQHAALILTELARQAPLDDDDVDYARMIGADPVRHTQWVAAVSAGYSGIFTIEEPAEVNVYAREMRLDGVEVAGVPFKGFIDRIDELPDGGLKVVDYKTGKDGSKPNPRFDDDHGDQIRLYIEALRVKLGEKPKAGYLYYIQHGRQRRVSISNTDINKTKRGFAASWGHLQDAVQARQFATRDSALCGWCPLVNACPTAETNGRQDRKGGAPSRVDLGIPSLRPDGTAIALLTVARTPATPDAQPTGAAHLSGRAEPPHDPDGGDMSSSTERRWRESKPYEGSEVDGHLSLNSYAATAVFGLSSLAAELLVNAGQKVGPTAVKALAGVLASVVLDAQAVVTNGSRDWQEGSNTRLRGVLRTAVDVIPLPFGKDEDAWRTWAERTHKFMVAVSATALDLYNNGPVADFAAVAQVTAAVSAPAATPAAA